MRLHRRRCRLRNLLRLWRLRCRHRLERLTECRRFRVEAIFTDRLRHLILLLHLRLLPKIRDNPSNTARQVLHPLRDIADSAARSSRLPSVWHWLRHDVYRAKAKVLVLRRRLRSAASRSLLGLIINLVKADNFRHTIKVVKAATALTAHSRAHAALAAHSLRWLTLPSV